MTPNSLRAKALAATPNWKYPSRWHGRFGVDARPNNDEEFSLFKINSNMANCFQDIEYIAAASPDVIISLLDRLERLESEHSEPIEPIFEPSSTIYKYDERTWAAQFYLGNKKIGIRFEADDRRDAGRKLGFAMKWALFGHDVAETSLAEQWGSL
jgi:hypothetical protein